MKKESAIATKRKKVSRQKHGDNEREGAVTGEIERKEIMEEDMTNREEDGSKGLDLKKREEERRG